MASHAYIKKKFKIPDYVTLNRLLKDPSGSKKVRSAILVTKMKQGEMKFLFI